MKPRIHILYEHGPDGLPFGSAYLRLLCPLGYPGVEQHFVVTSGPVLRDDVDVVIVDRLWRPACTLRQAESLVNAVRRSRAKLIYALDDALLALSASDHRPVIPDFQEIAQLFLQESESVLVTTSPLADYLAPWNSSISVLPHALDERLLATGWTGRPSLWEATSVVIGYMGTPTHDEDLALLIPALELAYERTPVPFRLEIIGGFAGQEMQERFARLPFPVHQLEPPSSLYPSFMSWFSATVRWDIAVAPLRDTIFNNCKSDVKFLDYSVIGAVGIYSRGPAYSSVSHGETGLLTENGPEAWAEALLSLISEPARRKELALAGRRLLFEQRVLAKRVNDWLSLLEQVCYTN